MRVLVVNNMAPFLWGGAEELASHLQKNLIVAGHDAEVLRIPFRWEPARAIPSQMLIARALEVLDADRVIALKFPAYLLRHREKTVWLLHQYRQAYDLYDAGHTNLPPGPEGQRLRALIKNADEESLTKARRVYTNSDVTRQRLLKYNGLHSEVLLPPVNDPEMFPGGPGEGYVFAGGRVNAMKRQHLLVEAMAFAGSNVRLVIAGPPDSQSDADLLLGTVERLGLAEKVHLDLRFLPRDVYAGYVNGATAVAYLPLDEDSLGYVTMEAATAGKALITTVDSGGILGLAVDGETGWVTEPTAEALGAALSASATRGSGAAAYGRAARDRWEALGVSWPKTVEALLQ